MADCCGHYTNDFANSPAPDARSLMRSRYRAFVLERSDYLLAMWHTRTRQADVAVDFCTKWLCLQVCSYFAVDADHAQVEFVARYA